MTLALLEMADQARAIALATAIGEAAGLPRCGHPRWRLRGGVLARHLRAVSRRGVVPPCVCASADVPSTRCPHVTWQAASVLAMDDGTVLVQAEAAALAARPEPRRVLDEAARDACEETWTLRTARRAEEG